MSEFLPLEVLTTHAFVPVRSQRIGVLPCRLWCGTGKGGIWQAFVVMCWCPGRYEKSTREAVAGGQGAGAWRAEMPLLLHLH